MGPPISGVLSEERRSNSLLVVCVVSGFWIFVSNACDRNLSRKARRILNELVFSEIEYDPLELPLECPFNPRHDLYLNQESQKSVIRNTQWRCSVCGKTFKSEFYLDRHFDNKHSDMLSHDAPVCLADFCDMLGCEDASHIHGRQVVLGSGCRKLDMEMAKMRCQATFHKCFPPEKGEIPEFYYNAFDLEICQRLSCDTHGDKKAYYEKFQKSQQEIWAARESEVNGRAIQVGLVSVFLICLVIYYAYLLYHKRETSMDKDFQRKSSQRRLLSRSKFD